MRPKEPFRNERTAGNRGVLRAEPGDRLCGRHFARVPDFGVVGKEHSGRIRMYTQAEEYLARLITGEPATVILSHNAQEPFPSTDHS